MIATDALRLPVAEIAPVSYDELEAMVHRVSEGRAPTGWGRLIARLCEDANVRADVVTAIAMHETGRWRYGGRDPIYSADPTFHNFGGIKTTDSSATERFDTDAAGCRGLVAHAAWYAHARHIDAVCGRYVERDATEFDPRHFRWGHRGELRTVADFGRGLWNTTETYAIPIAAHIAELWGVT